jgi:hypothetical protein
MDERKKSESSGEEAARVGPYQLEEQVPQDEYSQGSLYRAEHEKSGAPALVLERATGNEHEEEADPRPDVRVHFVSSAARGYDAMEVEQTPWSVAPERQSVESLVATLEEVHEAVGRMVDAYSGSPAPSRWRHLGGGLVGAAVVGALLFALVRSVPEPQTPSGPDSLAGTEFSPPSHEVPTDSWGPLKEMALLGETDGGVLALARPMPSKPYPGQKRPPCKPRLELELNGGCWVPHEEKAPCLEELFEHQGKCYMASMQPPKMPQSVGQ